MGYAREGCSQKIALIGRAILNNVGGFNAEIESTIGPIIVKGGNHVVWRLQKSALKPVGE